MAPRSKTLVGLDIEPHGITAAQVVVDGTGLVVRKAVHEPLEAGIVRDGEVIDAEALTHALQRLWKAHKGLGKTVRVGVANGKVVSRIVDLPVLAEAKELEAAVQFRAQDEIPMPLDGAVLDWQPLDVVDTPEGKRQRVILVAARRDMVERLLGAVRAAGLRCEGIDLAAFALVRALHRPEHDDVEGQVLYLSVGGLTNLAVAEGTTCLFTRSTGGGVEALAVELAERRQITLEDAREVLVATGVPLARAEPEPEGWGDVPDPAARLAEPGPEPETEVAPLRWVGASAADELFGAPDDEPEAITWASTEPETPTWATDVTVEVPNVGHVATPAAFEATPAPAPEAAPEPPTVELVPVVSDPVVEEAREVLLEGVRRIAAEVRTSMEFHGGSGVDARVSRVVLCGPASSLPGFAEALADHLNLSVEPLAVPGAPDDVPHVAVAAGLAVTEAPA